MPDSPKQARIKKKKGSSIFLAERIFHTTVFLLFCVL